MRGAWLLLCAIAGCGNAGHSAPDTACEPTTVFLDRQGGDYDLGAFDDATMNLSVVLDGPRTLPPSPYNDADWSELTSCIRDGLAPFPVTLTETDPGMTPHLELVFTTAYWGPGGAAVPTIIPSSCRPDHQIEFVFGQAEASPTNACEATMGAFAEMVAQLSPGYDCLDFTSPAMDCGIRSYLDEDTSCVDQTGQPAACRCGGTTQNSAQALRTVFGTCGN